MDEIEPPEEASLFPRTAGEKLRDARLAMGLDLPELAARTRIRERYLQAIEDGDWGAMQSPTYAVGFAKSYARAVGLDEVEIAREIRGNAAATARVPEYQPYETDDPARLPSRGLTLVAVLLGVAVLIGAGLWFGTSLFRGDGSPGPAPVAEATYAPETPVAAPTPDAASGQVALVATDEVWLRIYDAAGTTLLQKTLMPGERYDVPASADRPMINVGRPDKLQVLVNGSEVAPLGDGKVAIKDVGISAAALAARGQPAPAASATPAAATPAGSAPVPVATRPAAPASRATQAVPPFFRPKASPSAAVPGDPVIGNSGTP